MAQMYDHDLNPVKGWPSPYAIDKHGCFIAADANEVAYKGQVMSLNSNAKLQLGLELNAMPIFALNNSTDFDVVGDDGSLAGGENGVPNMSGLVALNGYEVESTEFDSAETYLPNDKLTAGVPGAADAGVIKPGTAYVDTICGVVSDGTATNCHQTSVLRFWMYFLPAVTAESSSSE